MANLAVFQQNRMLKRDPRFGRLSGSFARGDTRETRMLPYCIPNSAIRNSQLSSDRAGQFQGALFCGCKLRLIFSDAPRNLGASSPFTAKNGCELLNNFSGV